MVEPIFSDFLNHSNKEYNNQERKEVGDRVLVIDYSSITFNNGEELIDNDYDDFCNAVDDFFIIAETNQNNNYRAFVKEYKQDLVIYNPRSKKMYRIASRHVKLFN